MILTSSTPHFNRVYVDLCIYMSVCCFKLYCLSVFWLFLYAHSDTHAHTLIVQHNTLRTQTHINIYTHTHTHPHKRTQIYAHTHTYTRTHPHIHTCKQYTPHQDAAGGGGEIGIYFDLFSMFLVFNFLIQSRRRRNLYLYTYVFTLQYVETKYQSKGSGAFGHSFSDTIIFHHISP